MPIESKVKTKPCRHNTRGCREVFIIQHGARIEWCTYCGAIRIGMNDTSILKIRWMRPSMRK